MTELDFTPFQRSVSPPVSTFKRVYHNKSCTENFPDRLFTDAIIWRCVKEALYKQIHSKVWRFLKANFADEHFATEFADR